jgi:pimeloyl-ACP methyl ester carboxylesterase
VDLDLSQIRRRADADQRLATAIPDVATRQFLLQNLIERDGRFVWRFNLAAIQASLPVIASFPAMAGEYRGPVLFVHGGLSEYVRPEHEPAIRPRFPKADFARIEGAGHWVHAEQPELFVAAVAEFLRR